MGERVKKVTGKVKEVAGKLSKPLKIVILIVLVLAIGAIVALSVNRSKRPYAVLFTGLNQEDMTSVLTYLEDNGVSDYQVKNNDTILVREERAVELKAAILQEGYPTSGYAHTTYLDNVGMLSSESDRKQLTKYDLQDELSAVIRSFDDIRDASVNIATTSSSRNLLSDSVQTAKAAVKVEMQRGKELTPKLVSSIKNYVTHSVEGLEISDVVVTDTQGNEYTGDESVSVADAANLKLSLQNMINTQVRNSVMGVLVPYFGLSNVEVRVYSEVDTSRTYEETLQYLEPEWAAQNANGRGLIGKWVWDSGIVRGGENGTAGGTVGTSTNADLNEYVINEGDITGEETEIGTAGELDYIWGTQQTQRDGSGGVLTDLMVAVAINRSVLENDINRDDWVPLVARAAGIGTLLEDEKVAIQVYPFYVNPDDGAMEAHEPTLIERLNLPWWAVYAAIAGGVLFLILLIVILLLVRRAKKRRRAKEAAEAAERERLEALALEAQAQAEALEAQEGDMAEVPPEEGADIMDLNTDRTMALRKDVRQFAEENPAIAAQILKTWLHSEEA